MAGSKQKQRRRGKRRGTQAGTIKQSRRPGAKRAAPRITAAERREQRGNRPPSWRTALGRAAMTAAFLFVVFAFLMKRDIKGAVLFGGMAFFAYVPLFYFFDSFMYQRKQRQKVRAQAQRDAGKS